MANTFNVYGLTVNYLKDPCGIDENPKFSYKIATGKRGGAQKSYRITVKEALSGNTVWDSGEVESTNQVFIPYAGEKLTPITKYEYTVTATLDGGETACADGSFVTGKLGTKWDGKWITAKYVRREPDAFPAQYIRKTFELGKKVKAAYLAICGLGYFESSVKRSAARPLSRDFASLCLRHCSTCVALNVRGMMI